MDNDLIQDTNLDLLQVQVASVEYNGQCRQSAAYY